MGSVYFLVLSAEEAKMSFSEKKCDTSVKRSVDEGLLTRTMVAAMKLQKVFRY